METAQNERGSVMMEYVVLNFLFMVAIAIAGNFFVDPFGGGAAGIGVYQLNSQTGQFTRTGTAPQYGILGNAFNVRYDLMLRIVSMPYP